MVRWIFPDGEEVDSRVPNATDFLNTLKIVGEVTFDQETYEIMQTELVIDDEPWIAVVLK